MIDTYLKGYSQSGVSISRLRLPAPEKFWSEPYQPGSPEFQQFPHNLSLQILAKLMPPVDLRTAYPSLAIQYAGFHQSAVALQAC